MSFVKALAAVAAGFAAAKGFDKYKQMGGMAGLQDMLKGAGDSQAADRLGRMADQMGIPGGSKNVKAMLGQMGGATASATAAGSAGLASLMASMRGAADAGSKQATDMMEAVFGDTPAGAAMEQQARVMMRAMIQAAKADGEIDPEEQQTILDALEGASEEERAFVAAELAAPLDIPSLVRDAGDASREQVYATSLAAIRVDHAAEVSYLRQLAAALGLSDAQRDAIHSRMGVAPLSE